MTLGSKSPSIYYSAGEPTGLLLNETDRGHSKPGRSRNRKVDRLKVLEVLRSPPVSLSKGPKSRLEALAQRVHSSTVTDEAVPLAQSQKPEQPADEAGRRGGLAAVGRWALTAGRINLMKPQTGGHDDGRDR